MRHSKWLSLPIVALLGAGLVAQQLDGVDWSDWGRPERIESVLAVRRSRALVPNRAYAP